MKLSLLLLSVLVMVGVLGGAYESNSELMSKGGKSNTKLGGKSNDKYSFSKSFSISYSKSDSESDDKSKGKSKDKSYRDSSDDSIDKSNGKSNGKGKGWSYGKSNDKSKSKDESNDKSKGGRNGKSKDRSFSKSYSKSDSKSNDKSNGKTKGKSFSKSYSDSNDESYDKSIDKTNGKGKGWSYVKSNDKSDSESKDKSNGKSKNKSKDESDDESKGKSKGKSDSSDESDSSKGNGRGKNKGKGKNNDKDKSGNKDKDNGKSNGGSKGKSRSKSDSSDESDSGKGKGKDKGKNNDRNNDKDKDKTSNKDKDKDNDNDGNRGRGGKYSPSIEDIIMTDDSDATTLYMALLVNDANVAMTNPDDCESLYISNIIEILSDLLYISSNEDIMAMCVRESEPQYTFVNEIIVTITFDYPTELNNVLSMITDYSKKGFDLSKEIKYDLRHATNNKHLSVEIIKIDVRNIDQLYALCSLQAGTGYDGVSGSVEFIENTQNGVMTVNYDINGLSPGLHGIHVHESGDLRSGCSSTGGHYNPFGFDHSSPNSLFRHIGDLGNIEADMNGNAIGTISDQLLSLVGNNNIAGRGFVVHADEDDLGLGGDDGSLATGNAGGRVACCIIGVIST